MAEKFVFLLGIQDMRGAMSKDPLHERIVLILAAFKLGNPGIMYMHDRAPSHSAGSKIEKNLYSAGIVRTEQLPLSPEPYLVENT